MLFTKVIYSSDGLAYIFACSNKVRHNSLCFVAALFQLKAGLDYVFKRPIFFMAGFGQVVASFSSFSLGKVKGNVCFATGIVSGQKVGQGFVKLFL